jgi:hypothetical protein
VATAQPEASAPRPVPAGGEPTITHDAHRSAPTSAGRSLVLHIGSGKTGTSSVQHFLDVNRKGLAAAGWLYPRSPGRGRHTRLGLFLKSDRDLAQTPSWYRQKTDDPGRFRQKFRRRLLREVEGSGLERVLMSDEALYSASEPGLRRLRRLTDRIAGDLRVVVYLRRQDEHLVSRYQQVVKVGEVTRLVDWAAQDLSGTYDYRARLAAWERLVVPQRLVVRRFERDRFPGGSLLEDFMDACGVDVRLEDLTPTDDRNESLDAEAVEFLRLVNLHLREDEGLDAFRIDNRELVKRLARGSDGPTLTLPASTLDAFMAQWRESNRAVARDLLHDEDSELFASDRGRRRTTVEQTLDPDRFEHFFELAQLPEEMRAPLRRIAERESLAR